MSVGQLHRVVRAPGPAPADGSHPTMPSRPRSPQPSLRFRRIRALVLLLAVVLLVWGMVRLVGWAFSDHDATGLADPVVPPPVTSESATEDLANAVASRTEGIGGRAAVAVLDLDARITATYAAEDEFSTASIVKVDILLAVLLRTDGRLTDGQRAAAGRMIRNSDNGAATTLWKQIGGAVGLADANQQLGLTQTQGGTKGRWGITRTTAADQLRLLQVIYTDDSPLSAESRTYVRSLMSSVAKDQRWGVPAADDPGGEKAYVKNGWLPRSGGWIVNSIGQVEHHGHRLLIVALSDGRTSKEDGIDVLEGI
ncbi:MAG TPA: serine hydrolase, partial [Microlunatus sp.]|nr:serine hydrolase [Microlunatus sp.]